MAVTAERTYPRALHPLHAVLLAGTIPLFLGALLCDLAYAASYEIQWSNFASWLIAGGLVFCGLAILFALAGMLRAGRKPRSGLYLALLVATWILGFLDALHHARDAWATMPAGLVLSVIVLVLACLATWAGLSEPRTGGER